MGKGSRTTAGLLGAIVAALIAATPASAAFGELFYERCDSGRDQHPSCEDTSTATLTGLGSGLNSAVDVAASPDGDHVYALSGSDAAVSRFDRDPATGDLAFAGCVTGDLSTTACTSTGTNATADGNNSGLEDLVSLVISPDGASLYVVASGDDAIASFDRVTAPGASYGDLTFDECITGDTNASPPCTDATGATAGGGGSGMDNMQELAMADNGLYASADGDDAVVRVGRNPTNGNIVETAFQCISGSTAVTNCTASGDETASGANSGLDDVTGIAVDPDQEGEVYTTSFSDSAVVQFSRGAMGVLAYEECISGETASVTSGCTSNGADQLNGTDSGLSQPAGVAVSPDGSSLYVALGGDAGVAQFDRDTGDGSLGYQGCVTGQTAAPPNCVSAPGAVNANGDDSGLDGASAVVLPPDGRSLHLAAPDDSALASFSRDPGSGDLAFLSCVSGETDVDTACTQIPDADATGTDSGLNQVAQQGTIAATSDGKSVYAAAQEDDDVAEFDRENPPETQIDSAPPATTGDNTPSFAFSTIDPTAVSFACSVDGGAFGPCGDSTPPDGAHTTAALPDGAHTFAVRATDSFGFTEGTPATASFVIDTSVPPPPPPEGGGGAAADTDPPETSIASGPDKKTKKKRAKFEFTSDEAGSSFECDLDGKGFEPCAAAATFKVKKGKHTLAVRATDPAGNVDPTPDELKWKLKKKK